MVDDLVDRAAAELYALDPGEFTARRQALVAAAREAGEREAAAQIAALRRPTRAAWVVNRLSRENPELTAEFATLADQLRSAHLALDGAQLRELSKERRRLIDAATVAAYAAAGIATPTAALRDEVTATLGAVLADPDIAARFNTATLVTAEDQSGFGPGGPQLASVPMPARSAGANDAPARKPSRLKAAPEPEQPPARESARELRRKKAITAAEDELAAAEQAHDDSERTATATGVEVRRLTDALADARRQEDDALLDIRHAQNRVRKARQALERLRAN